MCTQELDGECDALRQQQRELRTQHKQLQEDKAAKGTRLAELQGRAADVQRLKFGALIDVVLLDGISLRNRGADELRGALEQQVHARVRAARGPV
jgi:hypothetical protein